MALEEAKSFSLAAGIDFFFSLRIEKGEISFSVFFCGRGSSEVCLHIYQLFQKGNMHGLYRLQKALIIGRRVHFKAVPS